MKRSSSSAACHCRATHTHTHAHTHTHTHTHVHTSCSRPRQVITLSNLKDVGKLQAVGKGTLDKVGAASKGTVQESECVCARVCVCVSVCVWGGAHVSKPDWGGGVAAWCCKRGRWGAGRRACADGHNGGMSVVGGACLEGGGSRLARLRPSKDSCGTGGGAGRRRAG